MISIADVSCGSRMFWFDRQHPDAVYGDNPVEAHVLTDKSSAGGSRVLTIAPDVQMDFTALPFPSETFYLLIFDPPHLFRNGRTGWLAKKYGKLGVAWEEDLRAGFHECFRVLKPYGTLIFKWNEHDIPLRQILALTPARPIIGNRNGKLNKSHWVVFMKDGPSSDTGRTRRPRHDNSRILNPQPRRTA